MRDGLQMAYRVLNLMIELAAAAEGTTFWRLPAALPLRSNGC